MDSVITISPIHTPYLLNFGKQFFVIAEREVVLEVTDFSRAMSAPFACYYNYIRHFLSKGVHDHLTFSGTFHVQYCKWSKVIQDCYRGHQ